jgi:hypothetical protein
MNRQKDGAGIEWRDIPGYEGIYQISSNGDVIRLAGSPKCKKTRPIKAFVSTGGYVVVALTRNSKPRSLGVHRLVCWAFLGEQGDLWVNHKNGVKTDNRLENLEYVTPAENAQHAYDMGLQPSRRGEANFHASLTEDKVWAIRMIAAHCLDGFPGGRKNLAKLFGISKTALANVLSGESWQHVEVYP